MKIEFNVKYGKNVIEIPITDKTMPAFTKSGMVDLFSKKVTIYNDISANDTEPRHFDRFIIDKCSIQGGYVNKSDNTIQNIVNAKTVITKDTEHYKSPFEYASLPDDERDNYYTVQVGDFIVFKAVDDEITTAQEFAQLQLKYKDSGIKITTVQANIYGLDVDNVTMMNT